MVTGDGLLARLPQGAVMTPAAFAAVCRAAAQCGNGLLEVTARGSLQARGLSPVSAPRFAEACRAAGIGEAGGPPVIASPLGALDPEAAADLSGLTMALRTMASRYGRRIAPKVAILVDDGGLLPLASLSADIRLRALGGGRLVLSIAGDDQDATMLATLQESDAVATVSAILDGIAALGPAARARDLARPRVLITKRMGPVVAAPKRGTTALVGPRELADGSFAFGLGLAFGQAEAGALQSMAEAATAAGARALAPVPGRVLLVLGLDAPRVADFAKACAGLGFITRADDRRRNVIACSGAPACSAGLMPARALAGAVAAVAAPLLAAGGQVHLSGCAKGCASRAAAVLTVVGMAEGCGIIHGGRAGDPPDEIVPAEDLLVRLSDLAAAMAVPARLAEPA
jgi:precorrin-3B synthase